LPLSAGQTVCRRGTQKPCYKIVYFHDASRRTSYEEAHLACRADGGHLVSIESPAEQRLIESFIRSLLASDGDFWIGLRRRKEEEDNSTECHSFYSWSDGSSSKFRNWYVDEPSCGGEVCVVLYHQPSAPPGLGGPYMFQWNDDRCNMKNNFICKYSLGNESLVRRSFSAPEPELAAQSVPQQLLPWDFPGVQAGMTQIRNFLSPAVLEAHHQSSGGVVCFPLCQSISWLFLFPFPRSRERVDVAAKGDGAWLPQPRRDSPKLDIYRVIDKQCEADLAGARPGTKNSSFRAHEGLGSPRRDPEGLNTSSSGSVTLGSSESGFVTNDIYELCGHRVGRSQESTWVDNEIYGY
ncbi:LAYN protein, partial [Pachycephala philippinensis]|nr:LAYN protein [Pachycephala philippinensis]